MCLAIPGRVVSVQETPDGGRSAVVDYPGLTKTVSLLYLPDVVPGDYVLVQAGFAIRRLSEDQAREVIEAMARADATLSAPVGES